MCGNLICHFVRLAHPHTLHTSHTHTHHTQTLRSAVCIFYLVLRALDTVEDDMSIPLTKKTAMLKEFHTHLYHKDWRFTESTEKDKVVLEEFPTVS